MRYLYTLSVVFLLLFSTNCFAEWRDAKNTKIDMTDEELEKFLSDISKEFFLPVNKARKGVKISAIEWSKPAIDTAVSLRYFDNKVDFEVKLFKSLWVGSGTIYLQLLDEDKFLMETILISKVVEDYTGDLLGNFNMNWDSFQKIKHYRLLMRN